MKGACSWVSVPAVAATRRTRQSSGPSTGRCRVTWHGAAAVEAAVVTLRSVWSGNVGGVGGFLRPDPPPPIVIGGFGPKMAALAGRVADGVNLPGGPGVARLLETAREAVTAAGRDPSAFIVTVSSDLRPQTLERLEGLGVDRVVAFVGAPSADRVRRMAPDRR